MRKILLSFAILIVAVSLQAQDFTGKLTPGRTYLEKSMSTFTLTNTDTVDIVVSVQQHQPFTIDVAVALDSISGNPTGTLYLQGRKADTEDWSDIANTVWSTADDDVLVSHTTAVRYRELRLRFITGGTGVTEADDYWVKLWLE